MSEKLLSVVMPVFNEEANIEHVVQKTEDILMGLREQDQLNYEIILVDDGSSDNSAGILRNLALRNSRVRFIELSRNFGHQNALKAGLDHAAGDAVISMDCDMQHPPELIPRFIEKWKQGYEVVYSIREEDPTLPMHKRKSSDLFYQMINNLSDIKLEPGSADFRLLDRKVLNVLINLNESELFLRGLVKWVGFKQFGIRYMPGQRHAGSSKYTLKKMMRFALDGVTSFSIRPLYSATYLGIVFSLLSVLFYVPYILLSLSSGNAVSGWASVMATVVFLGGLQLMILGVIGIYLGKAFMQSKQRPNYIIRGSSYQLKPHHAFPNPASGIESRNKAVLTHEDEIFAMYSRELRKVLLEKRISEEVRMLVGGNEGLEN